MLSRKMSAVILTGAVGCVLSTSAHAVVVYSTGFDTAGGYANGGLIGQDGWMITGASVVSPITVANTPNGNVSLVTTGQDVNRPYLPALTADNVFLSADITVSAAQAAGDYFMHLSDGGTTAFNARVYARLGSIPGMFQMALTTGSGGVLAASWGADLAMGTTYRVVAQYNFIAGLLNDTGTLFVGVSLVDPIYGVGDTAYSAAQTTGADAVSLSALALRQGTAASAATVLLDNMTVAYVPGPASLSLLAFGGLVATRRRRA